MEDEVKNEDQNNEEEKKVEPKPTVWQVLLDYLRDVCIMLTAVVLAFTFCVRFVVVSGDSMFDTLVDGDYLLLIEDSLCGDLEQGDIVVAAMDRFRDREPIVKRVIATEFQTVDIDFQRGIVYVDGVPLDEEYTFTPTNLAEGMRFPLVVDEGCLFLMGDNRNDSTDSRSPDIGIVDRREILGKAVFLIFPGDGSGEHPVERDYSRIGGLE